MLSSHMNKHGAGLCNVILIFTAILITILIWSAAPASGEIYRWQDKDGNWHFTDSPTSDNPSGGSEIKTDREQTHQTGEKDQAVQPVRGGLLWRLSIGGQSPSYLLGTIHSEDPRVTRLKPNVIRALDNSERFIMEMALDTNAFMHFGAKMMMAQGKDLESVVGNTLFTKIVTAMAEIGMPEPLVRRLKPWVVMSMLSMPKSEGGLILDMVLYQRATGQGKPTSGLETAQEQLAVFDEMSKQDQIALLKSTIEQLPSQPQVFEELITAYLSDNLEEIQKLAKQLNQRHHAAAAQRFMVRLNDQRNRRMVERIIPYLRKGNSFIAVGALHLGGPNGILSLLKKHGYQTESVR